MGPKKISALFSSFSKALLTSKIEDCAIEDDIAAPAAHNHDLVCAY